MLSAIIAAISPLVIGLSGQKRFFTGGLHPTVIPAAAMLLMERSEHITRVVGEEVFSAVG